MDRRIKFMFVIFLSIFAQSSFAAAITVNSDIDDAASVGSVPNRCTLREAIIAANTDVAVGGCSAGTVLTRSNSNPLLLGCILATNYQPLAVN